MTNFQAHGLTNWPYQYLYDRFGDCSSKYDSSVISVVDIDIEVSMDGGYPNIELADKDVTAISLERNGKTVALGVKPFDSTQFPDVEYVQCKDEKHLLITFLAVWESKRFSPDIITGWNIERFDIPYLYRRILRILGEEYALRLSPWKVITEREVMVFNKPTILYTLVGIATLDYMQLYEKFIVPAKGRPESMSLNFISQLHLGERKLDYSEYGDLQNLYEQNHQMYIEYNIRDVRLIARLEEKLNLIEIAMILAYDAGVNFEDVFGTIRPWDAIIHRYLMDRQIVIPFARESTKNFKIEGGHVKDPLVGMHRWVASVDLKSSYPHQIMQYNMGPETKIDKIEGIRSDNIVNGTDMTPYLEPGVCIAGNGTRYRTGKISFFSALMQENFDKRTLFRTKMNQIESEVETCSEPIAKKELERRVAGLDAKQHAVKIKINSLYGALANEYCRWYDPDLAEAITQSGQLAIKWAEKAINEELQRTLKTQDDYVIAIDTDSCYIVFEQLVERIGLDQTDVARGIDFVDSLMKTKFLPLIASGFDNLARTTNAAANRMSMNREIIADKGIWTGKKHYILNVCDSEGVRYAEPQIKMKGIEAVRSSTAGAARDRIKQAIKVIMSQDESALHAFVDECRKEFNQLPLDEIATPKGANDIDKWTSDSDLTSKGTPIQVKAAIYHNRLLELLGLTNYPKIKSGDKLKYVYLDKQNPYGLSCIAFMGILPPEFGLDEFVDRRVQFDKGFLKPIDNIVNAIGWNSKPKLTLDSFFS
jgi:DNA polymerase elongation subunit (family B)